MQIVSNVTKINVKFKYAYSKISLFSFSLLLLFNNNICSGVSLAQHNYISRTLQESFLYIQNDLFVCSKISKNKIKNLFPGVCKAGQYHNLTTQQCTDCQQGTYQNKQNQYSCQLCASGKTNYGTGMTACISKYNAICEKSVSL